MKSVFKIRRKADGLFSTGGAYEDFTKNGKAWASEQYLRSHLTMVEDYGDNPVLSEYSMTKPVADANRRKNLLARYANCEIVRFDMVESGTTPVDEYEEGRKK